MGFWTILIILIVVYIIGKFIYDSYLTNNTEKNWEEYERDKKYNETIRQTNHSQDIKKKTYNEKKN